MELVMITGKNTKYCQHLAQKLRVVGFKHYDADMYFIEDTGHYHFNAKEMLAARSWCKREALNAVTKDKSVVVSSECFSDSDLRAFRAINCPAELINVDKLTHRQIVERIQAYVQEKKSQGRWSQLGFRFMNMLRAS